MERSLEGRLTEGLTARFPTNLGLRVRLNENRYEIGQDDRSTLISLSFDTGEWTVWSPDAHAHREEFAQAADLAFTILSGEARSAMEYRGDTLSATWIEVRNGEVYEMDDIAAFLSPFEAEEWTLWPGERWRVVRRILRLGTATGSEEFERTYEEPLSGGPSMLPVLERALGTLGDDLRWAVDGRSRFVYPTPRGWRRRRDDDRQYVETHNFAEFVPPEEGLVFRKRCYFRDHEATFPKSDAQTFRPYSVERGLPEPESVSPGWSRHAWTLLFSDGEQEMMGILELLFVAATRPQATQLWRSIEKVLGDARYVPGDWAMGPET